MRHLLRQFQRKGRVYSGVVLPDPVGGEPCSYILLETGDYFLLETGHRIELEQNSCESNFLLLETGDFFLLETEHRFELET